MSNGTTRAPRLLDRVRAAIRVRHYSIRTEQAYVQWIRRFILFHGKRHPAKMGGAEIAAFLTHLAVQGNVAASTQNQALNAIVFLYRVVLERDVEDLGQVVRARKPRRLPVVLTPAEARAGWLPSGQQATGHFTGFRSSWELAGSFDGRKKAEPLDQLRHGGLP